MFVFLKKALSIFICVLAGASCLLLIFFLAGYRPLVVLSGSMEPSVPVGSLLIINTRDKDAEAGDIVTYSVKSGSDELYVTHRVIEVADDGGFLTKGDANETPDGYIGSDRVVGSFVFSIPYLGFLISKIDIRIIAVLAACAAGLNILLALFSGLFDDKEVGIS